MKAVKIIKNTIIAIILIAFFTFAIAITITMLNINKYGVTQFGDKSWIILKDKITHEKYKKGNLVIVEAKTIDEIKVGDEIFVYKVKADGGVAIDIGVIGETYTDEHAISFENGATYDTRFVIGGASDVYEDYGTYLGVLQSQWGFFFIILVPSFLIFIYELYAIVMEVKYGKDKK